MAPECRPCADLTLEKLLLLADEEHSGRIFPTKAYYHHHPSFDHLERAAHNGCDLCRLILDCFKGARRGNYIWPPAWEGPDADVEGSMYAAAKRLDVSDVRLALDSSAAYLGKQGVCVFDVMMVQLGNKYDYWTEQVPPLRLTLSASRGEFQHRCFSSARLTS